MKTFFKMVSWLVVCVVLLAIGLVIAVTIFVDPNDFREEIAQAVKKQTGRDLNIEGDLELTYYPWLGLSTGKVALANREGFGDTPMLQVDGAKVRAKLLPLLKKQIKIDTVVLESPKIDLQINSDGEPNWGDLVPVSDDKAAEPTGPEDVGAGVGALAVNGVEITNGDVRWQDQSAGQNYQISGLTLKTGDVLKGEPVELETALNISGDGIPGAVAIALNSTTTADLDNQKFIFDDLDFSAKGEGIDASVQTPSLSVDAKGGLVDLSSGAIVATYRAIKADLSLGSMNFDMNTQQLAAVDIAANVAGTVDGVTGPMISALSLGKLDFNVAGQTAAIEQLSGSFDGAVENVGGPFKVTIASSAVDADLTSQAVVANDLNVTFDGVLDAIEGPLKSKLDAGEFKANISSKQFDCRSISIDADLDGKFATVALPSATADVNDQTVSIPELTLTHADATVQAAVQGKQIIDAPAFSGRVSAQPFNLRQLMDTFDIKFEALSLDALASVGLDTQFAATTNSVNLSDLSAVVDASKINGSVAVNGFAAPAYEFDLSIDRLDLDKLLAKSEKKVAAEPDTGTTPQTSGENEATGPAGGVTAQEAAATEIPVETLRELKANGSLNVGALRYSGVDMVDVKIGLNAQDGLIQVAPLTANLYSGTLDGKIVVDTTGQTPAITVSNQFTAIDVGTLLQVADISDKLEGKGTFNIDLSAQGATDKALKASNSGSIGFEFRDGAVKGFDLRKMILEARSFLDKLKDEESEVEGDPNDETGFTELKGVINLQNGVASNKDLSLKAPLFRVGGDGSANIIDQTVDYLLSVTVANTAEGQGGEELEELDGVTVPITVRGSLADPKFRVDLKELVKSRIDKQLAVEKEKLKLQLEAEEAAAKAKLEAEEAEAKAKLEAKLEAEKAELKKKLDLEALESEGEGEEEKDNKEKLKDKLKKKLLEKLGS